MKVLLGTVITVHMAVILGMIVSFFLLPIYSNWWEALPCCSWIIYLVTSRVKCPLTDLENYLREKLGMRKIGGFVGHYIVKPVKIMLGVKKR